MRHSDTSSITRNIEKMYNIRQLDIPVQRLCASRYRFTIPDKGTWDFDPTRNTVKLVGAALDIYAGDIEEWVKNKINQ